MLQLKTIGFASSCLSINQLDDRFLEGNPFQRVLAITEDQDNIKDTPNRATEKNQLIFNLKVESYCPSPRFLRVEVLKTADQTCIGSGKAINLIDCSRKRSLPQHLFPAIPVQQKRVQRSPPDLAFPIPAKKTEEGLRVTSNSSHTTVESGIIIAKDFLRLLHNRLLRQGNRCFSTLSLEQCQAEFLIKVHYHKGDGTVICQWVYDPDCTLMKGDIFNPSDHNHLLKGKKGSTRVGFYSVDGQKALCFKEKPRYPFLEKASRLMNEALFGEEDDGIPNSETILMNGYSFTVSSYVEGHDFEDVMQFIEGDARESNPDFIGNLHRMKVLVMVISPEDGRAQNYILRKIREIDGHSVLNIVSIDNELSFINSSPHPSGKDPNVIIRGHTIIHCFSEKNPNYTDLKAILDTKTPQSIYEDWSKMVAVEKQYHLALGKHAKEVDNPFMPISESACLRVSICLEEIYSGLMKGDTLEQIFSRINPELFFVYERQATPVTPPLGITVLPSSSLRKVAAAVTRIDGSRLQDSATPLSACGEHNDYFCHSPTDPLMWHENHESKPVRRFSERPLPACA